MKSKKLKSLVRTILKEYLTSDMVSLKKYFMMTPEEKKRYLPHDYAWLFNDFLIEKDIDFTPPTHMVPSDYADEPDVEKPMFEDGEYELINWVETNNPELYNEFAEYLYDRLMHNAMPGLTDTEYPAWTYFEDNPVMVKNQWLIHFTNDADSIAREGFKYGVDDMTRLGLTTNLGDFEKKYGGYNFAYLLSDFQRYGKKHGGYKYGKEAVVFSASGIKLWHHGDEEPQVIFYGNTARNIIPVTSGENAEWALRSKVNGNILFESDELPMVVDWLVKNYSQYRKHL